MAGPLFVVGAATAASFFADRDEDEEEARRVALGLGRRRTPRRGPPAGKDYVFETDCISSDGESITSMVDAAKQISYETMLSHCDLASWAVDHGYEPSSRQGHGLTLKNDWHVGYFKSTYRGKPCYFLVWSAIEMVFVKK